MNKILGQLDSLMHGCLKQVLPNIKDSELEKDGALFYMNGKNGTAFDWYVNERFPDFFIFYSDKENLGAAKANLYANGSVNIYIYADNGHADPVDFEDKIEITEEELLELAVLLTENADDKRIWDEDIRTLETDSRPEKKAVKLFVEQKKYYEPMIERRNLISKTAIVSKRVREEGFKIGYGMRSEPTNERDSGWFFSVGNENEEYVNNPENLELWLVNSALIYDPDLSSHIDASYGTAIVRVASDKFELDEPGKEIHIEKRTRP